MMRKMKIPAFKTSLAIAALAAGLLAAAPAKADDRYELFNFNKLFRSADPGAGIVGRAAPMGRQMASIDRKYSPGSVVISTSQRRLYYVTAPGQAIQYGVGVGRPGFQWGGVKTVTAKKEWPSWTPPAQMLRRRPDLPRYMPGGLDNPLGARAMYLGSSLYRIHGSNEPETIGQAVSSGCFRMHNDDVVDLYNRVKVGARVYVLR